MSSKRDKFYYLFFLHVIPIIILVDLVPYYPPSIVPNALLRLSSFYTTTFHDPLVLTKPPWFLFFCLTEGLIQLPIAIYMVFALQSGRPAAPLWGFVYGFLAAFSTYACLCEFWWDGVKQDVLGGSLMLTSGEKWMLTACYGPYAAVFTTMTLDFGYRIYRSLGIAGKAGLVKKGK